MAGWGGCDADRILDYIALFGNASEGRLMGKFGLKRDVFGEAMGKLSGDGLLEVSDGGIFRGRTFSAADGLEVSTRGRYFEGCSRMGCLRITTNLDVMCEVVSYFGGLNVSELCSFFGADFGDVSWVCEILSKAGLMRYEDRGERSAAYPVDVDAEAEDPAAIAGESFLEYDVIGGVRLEAEVAERLGEYAYSISYPVFGQATKALMDHVYSVVSADGRQDGGRLDYSSIKKSLGEQIRTLVDGRVSFVDATLRQYMIWELLNEMHLGRVEYLLWDRNIEEIKVQSGRPVYIKHVLVPQDWVETNVVLEEPDLLRYAKAIACETTQQVDASHPMMDAILHTGDRVNVCLPETGGGSTVMDIRVFSKSPWNIVRLVGRGTVDSKVLAFLWLALQSKFNILVSGETGCGKTSFVNALCVFLPRNDHIVSVEDTRELRLPTSFRNWSHLTTKNSSGQGLVTMDDLLINSLRMSPSFLIMGEVRSKRDIEALMRATAMGHPVLSTIHTRDCDTTVKRFVDAGVGHNDLVNIHLNVILESVAVGGGAKTARRVREVGEYVVSGGGIDVNRIYSLDMGSGGLESVGEPKLYFDRVKWKTNMSPHKVHADLDGKRRIIDWLVRQGVEDLNVLSRIVHLYYQRPECVLKAASVDFDIWEVLGDRRPGKKAVAAYC